MLQKNIARFFYKFFSSSISKKLIFIRYPLIFHIEEHTIEVYLLKTSFIFFGRNVLEDLINFKANLLIRFNKKLNRWSEEHSSLLPVQKDTLTWTELLGSGFLKLLTFTKSSKKQDGILTLSAQEEDTPPSIPSVFKWESMI